MRDPLPILPNGKDAAMRAGIATDVGDSSGWSAPPDQRTLERERLETRARVTDAARQLLRCFPRWQRTVEQLTSRALERLAGNEPLDPNDPDVWRSRDAHAQAVLHRHGQGKVSASRLTSAAIAALIDGQALADREAGLDWSTVTVPASALDERLRRAHARLPIEPRGSGGLGVPPRPAARARPPARARGRSRGRPVAVGARPPRPVRRRGPALLADRLGHAGCRSPASSSAASARWSGRSACSSCRRSGRVTGGSWCRCSRSTAIRLIAELGGRLERDLRSAVLPIGSREALLERINVHTLHAGPRECLDSAGQLAQELSRELRTADQPGRAAREARPVGAARRPPPLLQGRRRHEHGRARAPGR